MNATRLIREAAESVSGIHDPLDRLARQVGALQASLRDTYVKFTGIGQRPQRGCAFFTATAGDASVLIEYEYSPPEAPVYSLDSPMCGPGCPAEVSIIQALVNGAWCDPNDVFPESLIEKWAEQIAESEAESIASAREEYECERWERQQEALAERGYP